MDYVGHVIRPPSEAYSLILQVTVGCSHNMCTFCGTYKEQKYRIKDMERIKKDIEEAARYASRINRVFLADGDVLMLPAEKIQEIISYTKNKIPHIERFGVYGNTKSILKKTPKELADLRNSGLGIVYQGIESGNREVLKRIKKGAFPHKMKESAERVMNAGIKLSQTVLLGIGGTELSEEHARDTGKLLGEMSPDYASALTVMILPNTELYQAYREGTFKLPDKFGLLNELKIIIENMDVKRKCMFTSNHASNYLPIRATLPDDRKNVIALLDRVLRSKDESMLKPEYMRAL